jgi:ESAT-6 family protein
MEPTLSRQLGSTPIDRYRYFKPFNRGRWIVAGETFRSDRESIVHGATKVRQVRADVSGDLDKLRNVIDDLVAQGWHGSASEGFAVVMNSWDGSVKKLMVAMDEIAKLLDKSGASFSMTDSEQRTSIMQTRDYSGALGQRLQ